MRTRSRVLFTVAAVALAGLLLARRHLTPLELGLHTLPSGVSESSPQVASLVSGVPAAFVPNLGQWDGPARYVARVDAMTVFLEQCGWTFRVVEREAPPGHRLRRNHHVEPRVRGAVVRMTFTGARTPRVVAEQVLPGRHNYFLGNDPSRWRSDVPRYASVRYADLYAGVDVRAREHDGHFEYDVLLDPDADLEQVEMVVEGTDGLRLEGTTLVLETAVGPVRMPPPVSYERGPHGEQRSIECSYVLRTAERFGFTSPRRRPGWALTVDPGLVWSTYLGGQETDEGRAVVVDFDGSAIVAGWTLSMDFPSTPGAFGTSFNGGVSDTFVTRLSPTGSSLVYSTFLGGNGNEGAEAIALHGQGVVTIAGGTAGRGFPTTTGAFDTTFNGGGGDAFVTRLSASGGSLLYSTYLGGTAGENALAVAVDPSGEATVAGYSFSQDFPTTAGAFDTTYNGAAANGFVARLDPSGSKLAYSTFLSGTSGALVVAVALDRQGAATVTGSTYSTDFPTHRAFDSTHNGNFDTFVSRLSPSGSSLIYSTFLGGPGDDDGLAIAVDADGAATVAGVCNYPGYPTTAGAYDTSFNGPLGETDGFVTRLSPSGASLIYSTLLGGALPSQIAYGGDVIRSVALDANGGTTLTGFTTAPDFPTTPGAFDRIYRGRGGHSAFVARLDAQGSRLVYSTFFGDAGSFPHAVALDASGGATIAGVTHTGVPTTTGAYDRTPNGKGDVFVSRFDMLPTGVTMFGNSSPGCSGPLPISVTSMPSIGNGAFSVTCGNAPPKTAGALAIAGAGLSTPIRVLGIDLWLDARAFWLLGTTISNAIGAAEVALPVPQDPRLVGGKLYAQFLWLGPTSPAPCPRLGLSSSSALEIVVQP